MNMFKSAALFLGTLGIMGATALTVDTPKVSADEATATIQVNTFTPSAGNVYGADTFKESKIGGTWIVKQGIKGIIRNKSAATGMSLKQWEVKQVERSVSTIMILLVVSSHCYHGLIYLHKQHLMQLLEV